MVFKQDGETRRATTTILDEYTDESGHLHFIELLNAHSMPDIQENTVNFPIPGEPDLRASTVCIPYDDLDVDMTQVDQNEPIRDLALCDVDTKLPREEVPDSFQPLDPSLLNLASDFHAEETYTAYGFPTDNDMTATEFKGSENAELASYFEYEKEDRGYGVFQGEAFGPGGSGGVLLNESGQVEAIMAGYQRPSRLAIALYNLTGYVSKSSKWFVEKLPSDLKEKVAYFKEKMTSRNRTWIERTIFHYRYQENFSHKDDFYLPRSKSE